MITCNIKEHEAAVRAVRSAKSIRQEALRTGDLSQLHIAEMAESYVAALANLALREAALVQAVKYMLL